MLNAAIEARRKSLTLADAVGLKDLGAEPSVESTSGCDRVTETPAGWIDPEAVCIYRYAKGLLSRGLHDNRRLGFVYDAYPFVIPGLDSIDASSVKTDFLAHSFFSDTRTVLGDLAAVVLEGKEPSKRFGLKKLTTPSGPCWKFD